MHPYVVDLTGKRFGRLEVLELSPNMKAKAGNALWLCVCECGNLCEAIKYELERGMRKSCGCYRADRVTTHGESKTRLYRVWHAMLSRCNNETHADYRFYGAKGVRVYDEWRDYAVFRRWAKANGYAQGLTIDRKESSDDYDPANCRWITIQAQQRNRRNGLRVVVNGVQMAFEDALDVIEPTLPRGVTKKTVRSRVSGYGWTFERAISVSINSTKGFAAAKIK